MRFRRRNALRKDLHVKIYQRLKFRRRQKKIVVKAVKTDGLKFKK
jgi:hypothetical protein